VLGCANPHLEDCLLYPGLYGVASLPSDIVNFHTLSITTAGTPHIQLDYRTVVINQSWDIFRCPKAHLHHFASLRL